MRSQGKKEESSISPRFLGLSICHLQSWERMLGEQMQRKKIRKLFLDIERPVGGQACQHHVQKRHLGWGAKLKVFVM